MTGETDPVKKNIISYCIDKRNSIIEEGAKVNIYLFIEIFYLFKLIIIFFINYINIFI